MSNKTLFCVSTANTNLFKDNFRNSFTNYLPQITEKSLNYKLCLGSIHLEKSFRTIGKMNSIFLFFTLKYNDIDEKYQDHSNYNPVTIHKHFLHKFTKVNQEIIEIVLVLSPGRYRSSYELADTINYDLTQLGIKKYITFKQQSNLNRISISITNTVLSCIISIKLLEIFGFNTHKSKRVEMKMKDISQRKLKMIAYANFIKVVKPKKIVGLKILPGKEYVSTHKIRQDTYLPNLIKIYCSQLDETIDSSKFNRLLAVCPGIGENNRQIYEYQPLNLNFARIAVSELDKLYFELRNEKDELLELDIGTASYLRLLLQPNKDQLKMNTLTIFSSDKLSKQLYPTNSNTAFTIQLPTTLSQGTAKRWTMKLTQLSIPRADINVTKDFGFIRVKVYDRETGMSDPYKNNVLCTMCTKLYTEARHDLFYSTEIVATCKKEKHLKSYPNKLEKDYSIIIPPKDYKTMEDLHEALTWSILNETSKQWEGIDNLPAGIEYQNVEDKRHLSAYNNFENKEVSFGLPFVLAYMLGVKNNVQVVPELNKEIPVSNLVPSWHAFSDKFVWMHVKPKSKIKFPFLPDLNAGKARHAKIQCGEIKSTIFAGAHENLLSFYSLQSGIRSKDMYFFEFTHPLEVEINSQHLDSLSFRITAENSNDEILFANKNIPIFLSLVITKYD